MIINRESQKSPLVTTCKRKLGKSSILDMHISVQMKEDLADF